MSRKDELEEKTDRGKASKRAGAAGAIARGVAYTRARFGNGDGGVPVVSIVVLVAIAAVTFGVLAAPGLAQAQASGSVELSATFRSAST